MKAITFILVTVIVPTLAQTADSTYTTDAIHSTGRQVSPLTQSFYDANGQKKWITKGHVTIVTNKLRLSSVEEEISELESIECNALRKRDTTALRSIWLRDFTLDGPQNELHIGKNPIPYYLSFTRVIEKFTIIDDVVYTSGYENAQRLKSDRNIDEVINQNYSHMWIRKFGAWKLATKNSE